MRIAKVYIKNFRSIQEQSFDLDSLSILIGDNWTGKTSILEAINYALSPSFLSGRIKVSDFYNWTDESIIIQILFDQSFMVSLPDGFTKQQVDCNGVYLEIKKRDRSSPWKAFSDPVVVTHYVVPVIPKGTEWWSIKRKKWTNFNFTERSLSFPLETDWFIKSFYFWKNREKQIQKWFNTSFSSLVEEFNRQFSKSIRAWWEHIKSDFLIKKNSLEDNIKGHIDEKIYNKTIDLVNGKLMSLWIQEIDFTFIDEHAPFDSAYLCNNLDGIRLPLGFDGIRHRDNYFFNLFGNLIKSIKRKYNNYYWWARTTFTSIITRKIN